MKIKFLQKSIILLQLYSFYIRLYRRLTFQINIVKMKAIGIIPARMSASDFMVNHCILYWGYQCWNMYL